jgi:hypothetical protein
VPYAGALYWGTHGVSIMYLLVYCSMKDDAGMASYEVCSGVMEAEAIELFQRFYAMENTRAPVSKRRKKEGREFGGSDESSETTGDVMKGATGPDV